MIVRFNRPIMAATAKDSHAAIGVEGDVHSSTGKLSEVEKIVGAAKRKVETEGVPGVGVSGSNSGKGHDPKLGGDGTVEVEAVEGEEERKGRVSMEKVVEEEPGLVDGDKGELDPEGAMGVNPETRKGLSLPEGVRK